MNSIIDSKADVPAQPWLDSGFRLWQLSNAWQRHVADLLKDLEITHVQYLLLSLSVVLIFKGGLSVNIPGGKFYDFLPQGLQRISKTYF